MMFSAGMGTGLVFWGVAEPMMHFGTPLESEPRTPEALAEAMRITFFHWGLQPLWAISHRSGPVSGLYPLPAGSCRWRPRSMLYPLIGERIHGPIGHGVDILVHGSARCWALPPSLGLGVMQINQRLARRTPRWAWGWRSRGRSWP